MSLQYLLDTNILIFILRNRTPALRQRLSQNEGALAVSTVTVHELQYGVERSARPDQNRVAVDSLLDLVEVLPFDRAAAEHAGRTRAALARTGEPIGAYDVLIAAHARSIGLVVVTNSRSEFERVPGLLVEDWS